MTIKIHGIDNIQPNTIGEQSFASTIRLGPRVLTVQVTNSNYQAINASLSTTNNNNYIVITGEKFVNSVVSVGSVSGGNLQLAIQTQVISTSELRVRLPAMSSGLYSLFISNQDGGYTIATNILEYYNTNIAWTTPNNLPAQTLPVQLTATGGTITYTSSNIPSGLTLSSSGLLSGTPTSNGLSGLQFFTLQFTVTASNGTSTYPRVFNFKYVDDGSVVYNTSHQLLVNEYVEIDLASSNEITFSASSLPSGLSIDSTGTKLTGTPTVLQNSTNYTLQPKLVREGTTYNFPVKTLAIIVAPIKFTTSSNLNTWDNGTAPTYSQQIAFSPSGISATYSITNTSMNTITINSSAVVSGTILDLGSSSGFNYTVQATSSGINITRTFTQPLKLYDHWLTINSTKYYASLGQTFVQLTQPGGNYTVTVPSSISVTCKLWGASGGNGQYNSTYQKGGSGGYASGDYTLVSGTQYYVRVGEGGRTNNANNTANSGAIGGIPGGGNTGMSNDGRLRIGSGGGYTGLFFTTNNVPIIIAGAGGGAGTIGAFLVGEIIGGHGGGNTGESGQAGASPTTGGGGGTQSSGGAAGTNQSGITTGNTAGSYLTGGRGASTVGTANSGGGGGAGYYGGGGGGMRTYQEQTGTGQFVTSGGGGASGGGGSNYVNTSLVTNSVNTGIHVVGIGPRTYSLAPNYTDLHYISGVAVATTSAPLNSLTGGPGLFVFVKPTTTTIPGPTLAIGDSYQGGYYAGLISYSCNGIATHRLIVSPKAAGETVKQWKTVLTNSTGTNSVYDGWSNTNNMNTTEHPLAQWARTQSIGGFGDWYIPSYYELEILYYNLKPTTQSNTVISSAYGNNGGCGTLGYGLNSYAVPARITPRAYTASAPAQTTIGIFQTTHAFSAELYWSSTQGWPQSPDVTVANGQNFSNGEQTLLLTTRKTEAYRARLIRREAL